MFKFLKKFNEVKDSVMSTEILIKAKTDKKILYECVKLAKDFEEKLSAYKETSYIAKINRMAGKEPVYCPSLVIDVVKQAIEVSEETNGLYDPTIGVLTLKVYQFGKNTKNLPDKNLINQLKTLVNYKNIEITGNYIYLTKKGMSLDLGGIGKGYASSMIAEYLYNQGVDSALVSIGGEICCYGKNWNIAIKHPRKNEYLAILKTTKDKTTISTSGDYERYINSFENHHILDTRTGKQNLFYASLTLVEKGFNGGKLDAYTTAMFNMTLEEVFSFTEKKPFETFIIFRDYHNIMISSNFHKNVYDIKFL